MRAAEFNREYVLHAAMNAFITKGYYKTSMQDLKKATGLHPGSIYCAFENKRGLLLAALDHYVSHTHEKIEACFSAESTVMGGFRNYFDLILESIQDNEADCLLQKSLVEVRQDDEEVEQIIRDMIEGWQQFIRDKITQAQQNGEITGDQDVETLTHFIASNIFGLRSYSNVCKSPDYLRKMTDRLLADLTQRA